MEQDDIERLLEKRWKRYRAAQKRRKATSGALEVTIRAAGITATFLRKVCLLKQVRKEKIAVE